MGGGRQRALVFASMGAIVVVALVACSTFGSSNDSIDAGNNEGNDSGQTPDESGALDGGGAGDGEASVPDSGFLPCASRKASNYFLCADFDELGAGPEVYLKGTAFPLSMAGVASRAPAVSAPNALWFEGQTENIALSYQEAVPVDVKTVTMDLDVRLNLIDPNADTSVAFIRVQTDKAAADCWLSVNMRGKRDGGTEHFDFDSHCDVDVSDGWYDHRDITPAVPAEKFYHLKLVIDVGGQVGKVIFDDQPPLTMMLNSKMKTAKFASARFGSTNAASKVGVDNVLVVVDPL